MSKTFFTVKEVAEQLSVTKPNVHELIATKRLAAINVSRGHLKPRWRISSEAVERFLESASSLSEKPAA